LFGRAKFDEPAFYFTVRSLTNKPAVLRGTIVVRADTRAASVGGDHRLLERTFSETVKVAAEGGLEVQSVTALK
jgi:hypothetical protein